MQSALMSSIAVFVFIFSLFFLLSFKEHFLYLIISQEQEYFPSHIYIKNDRFCLF